MQGPRSIKREASWLAGRVAAAAAAGRQHTRLPSTDLPARAVDEAVGERDGEQVAVVQVEQAHPQERLGAAQQGAVRHGVMGSGGHGGRVGRTPQLQRLPSAWRCQPPGRPCTAAHRGDRSSGSTYHGAPGSAMVTCGGSGAGGGAGLDRGAQKGTGRPSLQRGQQQAGLGPPLSAHPRPRPAGGRHAGHAAVVGRRHRQLRALPRVRDVRAS